MNWNHSAGYYCNKNFRIFLEGRKWWLSDTRNGTKAAPSWWFYTAKEAKDAAELVITKPCGIFGLNLLSYK
jgi:hypothetical protein